MYDKKRFLHKGTNVQTINGKAYFMKRAQMPDDSWRMVYAKNERDWERKSKIQYGVSND